MQVYAIAGLIIINCILGVIAMQPHKLPKPEFQTLAIWQTESGQTGVIRWIPGVVDKETLKHYPNPMADHLKLMHTYVIEGRHVDAEWAKSRGQ